MIIHSLELHNFRQFEGTQKITFSTDPAKKATILIAESGFGKTTLLRSFQWAFYGSTKYTSGVINTDVRNSMKPNSKEYVSVKVVLSHKNHTYEITRKQVFWKNQVRVDSEDSEITIDEKNSNGITQQLRGREAQKLIRSIMHPDLYPYFFLEGEKAESIGEQMSKGKSGANNEFVQAVKGLLGFTYLYETQKHIKGVIKTYQDSLRDSTANTELKKNIEAIQRIEEDNVQIDERLDAIKNEMAYYKEQRDILSEKIQKYSGVAEKQQQTRRLTQELDALDLKINQQKTYLFRKFSNQIPYLAMQNLVSIAEETLKNTDALDKGIPGINVEAVQYMLKTHKCICGEDLTEGSEHWNTLQNWITYLPPNNIGYEIETFSTIIKSVKTGADTFSQDYEKARKDLNDYIRQRNDKVDLLETLNKEIGSVSENVSSLKEQELSYSNKITLLATERGHKQEQKDANESRKQSLLAQQAYLRHQDEKTSKVQDYLSEAEDLAYTIGTYVQKREKEKREALEEAINKIFRAFYKGEVKFRLDDNYYVSITGFDNETYADFTSGGQDVAVALAFIGAIVKLKIEAGKEENEDDEFKEVYPLIMDAPTSKFGEAQVKSFSTLMPNLTDQVIIFVNDVYGPKLVENMKEHLGEEWTIDHKDEFHDTLRRVK